MQGVVFPMPGLNNTYISHGLLQGLNYVVFSFYPSPAPQLFDSQHSWAQFQQVTQDESREYLILRNSNRGQGQGRSREVQEGLTTPNTLGYGQTFRGREEERRSRVHNEDRIPDRSPSHEIRSEHE